MSTNESFEKKFEKAFSTASGANIVFPYVAKQQMGKMVEVIAKGNENIMKRLATNQKSGVKGGFVAEEFHAETFNLDAILKDSDTRAITDRYTADWQAQGLKGNDNPDLVILKNDTIISKAQSKYYKTSEKTAGQFSQINPDGSVKYGDMDAYIGPSDQINPTNGGESVAANASRRAQEKAANGEAALAESFNQTSQKVTDTLSDGECSSTPLSKQEADAMGAGDLEKLKAIENKYQTRSTIQQMGNAAKNAAALSAVVCGSINIVRYVQQAKAGTISEEEAVVKVFAETAAAAADSAIKAGANAGLQSLIVRYGGEQAVIGALAKQGAKNLLRTNAVTVGVVCAVDAIKDMVALGMGKISKEQFYERQGKGMLNTGAGVIGGSLGALGAEAGCLALGASSVPVLVPLLGGLAGGLIAGIAMMVAIENGIERPYRELLFNTGELNSAATELQRLANNIFAGQVLFTKILAAEVELDKRLDAQMAGIDKAGRRALESINSIK